MIHVLFSSARRRTLPVAAILLSCGIAQAAPFTSLTVFGDSLSDNGNAYLATGGIEPGLNYGTYTLPNGLTTQHFSDGPDTSPVAAGSPGIWIDQLASKLGVADPTPYLSSLALLPPGSNYATGGAETGISQPQDVGNQVALFTASHLGGADSNSLYIFWAGANDILLSGANPTDAADNIQTYIEALHGLGAQKFLWLNLPLLGEVPDGKPFEGPLNGATQAFNGEWAKDLAALQGSGISATGVDIQKLFSDIGANPSAYGFTNITDPAQGLSLPTDDGYLFWDGVHPTTAGHTLVADAATAALVATPEPASLALVLLGVLAPGLKLCLRRRSK